jgi:hypothetical protein
MKMKNHYLPLRSGLARGALTLLPFTLCCGALAVLAGCESEPDSHLVSAPPPPPPNRTVITTTTTTSPVGAPAMIVSAPAGYVATPGGYIVTTAPTPVLSTTIVTQAPPALQQEVVLAQPSPQHVWLAGYWTWRNNQYEWMAGHWELPPSPGSTWVLPRWESENGAYRFYEGYWS